jgi:hypothetical protein
MKPTEAIQRYINEVNERVPALYWDGDHTAEELEFLAELGQAAFSDGRLRSCVKCNQLFYAVRIDATSCSKKCANHVRVIRQRARNREFQQEPSYAGSANPFL